MRTSIAIIGLVACSAMLTACKPSSSGDPASAENKSIAAPAKAKKPTKSPSWLSPQAAPDIIYPAFTNGSPYDQLLDAVILDWGKQKDEFESSAEFRARISKIPEKVTEKFGKHLSFKSMLVKTEWDADAKKFKIIHDDRHRVTMGSSAGFMYGLNVQGCSRNPTFETSTEQAKYLTSGIDDGSIGLFYNGTIDFSKRGWVSKPNGANWETIPGFHRLAFPSAYGGAMLDVAFDFDVRRIEFVKKSTGEILESVNCQG